MKSSPVCTGQISVQTCPAFLRVGYLFSENSRVSYAKLIVLIQLYLPSVVLGDLSSLYLNRLICVIRTKFGHKSQVFVRCPMCKNVLHESLIWSCVLCTQIFINRNVNSYPNEEYLYRFVLPVLIELLYSVLLHMNYMIQSSNDITQLKSSGEIYRLNILAMYIK